MIRPLEADKRVFVVEKLETLNQNQNKLLKTLEEPPKNVVLLIGAEKSSAILPTIKSRAKKIDIPLFSTDELLKLTKEDFPAEKLAKISALLAGGKVGLMERKYRDEGTIRLFDSVVDFLYKARSARDLPVHVSALSEFEAQSLIATLKICLNEMTRIKCGYKPFIDDIRLREAAGSFPQGALLSITERLNDMEKAAYFNGNQVMLKDGAVFAVLEEKAKWLKL